MSGDEKISQLASGSPAQAGDEYVVARSGSNYKLTLTNIAATMPPIGASTPNTGAFTTVDATTVEVTNVKAKDGTAAASIADSTGVVTVSTKVEFADGSASAPTVTNTGDTNTGVYFPAADEVAVTTGGTVAAVFNSNGLFFRNRIINGDMRIDQRNAGAAVTLNNTAAYTVDRWYDRSVGGAGTGVMTVQQSTTAPTGYTNSKLTTITTSKSPAASEQFWFFQAIEGLNIADFNFGSASALTFTLSFWVRASVTGTYSVAFQNSAQNRSYVATYTVNAANTYEQKTITVAGDTSGTWLTTNGVGMYVFFDTGSGSNFNTTAGAWGAGTYYRTSGSVSLIANSGATLYVTGVQLETGSVATPFERRPFTTELQLCQRYFCKSYNIDVAPGTSTAVGGQSVRAYSPGAALNNVTVAVQLKVTMRATPTVTIYSGTGGSGKFSTDFAGTTSVGSVNTHNTGMNGFTIENTGVATDLMMFHYTASIEL